MEAYITDGDINMSKLHLSAHYWEKLWQTDSSDYLWWGRKLFTQELKSEVDKAGVIYKKPDGELNLQKIYGMLKWDNVAIGFVGSSWGAGGEELPSLVRELELTFHTEIGHDKFFSYNSDGITDSKWYDDWRKYLEKRKLVIPDNNKISFSKRD